MKPTVLCIRIWSDLEISTYRVKRKHTDFRHSDPSITNMNFECKNQIVIARTEGTDQRIICDVCCQLSHTQVIFVRVTIEVHSCQI